jgi:hypothetical protein
MALPVVMRAREDGDVARGIDTDIRTFEQAAACAKLARDARGCQTASLDIGDKTMPRTLPRAAASSRRAGKLDQRETSSALAKVAW